MRWVDALFRLEEINGGGRCPAYLYRWTVAKLGSYRLYLHHFVGDDWSLDLHDHPKRFVSIGLKGSYVEYTPDSDIVGLGEKLAIFRAPWIRSFPAEHIHRLRMIRSGGANGTPEKIHDCWTLVVTLKATRGWGFWHLGSFVPWRKYVGGSAADGRTSCK